MSKIPKDIYTRTQKRLVEYGFFSKETVKKVADVAVQQIEYRRYQDYLASVGVPEVQLHTANDGGGVPVVDIPAKAPRRQGVLVVHLPMGNPLDSNQLFQVATIAAANPEYRVISFGNPSGGPFAFRQQNLTALKRQGIASGRKVAPLVAAELDYLKAQGIRRVVHAGYSYGALKATLASSVEADVVVEGLVCIEPVAHPRSIVQLVGDFLRTDAALNKYVNRSGIPVFIDARKHAVKGRHYTRGLIRPINIAVAYLLARIDFIPLFKNVLAKWPKLHAMVVWAGKSELGNDAHMKANFHGISHNNPRVHTMRLTDDVHAFANDIHLHAAIICEALVRMR